LHEMRRLQTAIPAHSLEPPSALSWGTPSTGVAMMIVLGVMCFRIASCTVFMAKILLISLATGLSSMIGTNSFRTP